MDNYVSFAKIEKQHALEQLQKLQEKCTHKDDLLQSAYYLLGILDPSIRWGEPYRVSIEKTRLSFMLELENELKRGTSR